jgi:hypothetical protein
VAAEVLITGRPDPHPLCGPGDFQRRKQEQEADGAGTVLFQDASSGGYR